MRMIGVVALSALALSGCAGKENIAIVPAHPIYLCVSKRDAVPGALEQFNICLPFDARRLLGLKLRVANATVRRYGYSVRRKRPLKPNEVPDAAFLRHRIDVETGAPTENSTVIRIIGQG
jgi:hypothetical protein